MKNSLLQNPRSMFIGVGEFSFSEGASSALDAATRGYVDYGNIKAFTLQAQPEKQTIEGSRNGSRVIVKNIPTVLKLGYLLKSNEADHRNLQHAFMGNESAPFTQAALAAQNGTALPFDVTPAEIGRWYDLRYNGARIRELTLVTIAGKTEGEDFIVDKKSGRIRFLTAQAAALVPVLTAPVVDAASAGYLKGITPLAKPIRLGYGRLIVKDADPDQGLVFDHCDFSCELSLESIGESGKQEPDIGLMVTVTDVVGTVFNRD